MTTTIERVVKIRHVGIDRIRGLAIAIMIFDHLVLVFQGPQIIRETITRTAMPLFFLLGGYMLHRFSWRIPVIGVTGILLPMVVPFIDDPNVLFYYALFAPAIIYGRKYPVLMLGIVAFALTYGANYYVGQPTRLMYHPVFVLALMAAGTMIPRRFADYGNRLPGFLTMIGQHPLSIYVGHVLFLSVVFL